VPLPNADLEEAVIRAFVVSQKRERYIELLRSPKRRREFLSQLYHFHDFEPACLIPLKRSEESAEALLAVLRRQRATTECYVISANAELDGMSDELARVIPRVYGQEEGTIVSCVPGRLAYYEGEPPQNRFILKKA
jgi:hypothetical protein